MPLCDKLRKLRFRGGEVIHPEAPQVSDGDRALSQVRVTFNFKSVADCTLTTISYPRTLGRGGIAPQNSDLLRSKLLLDVSFASRVGCGFSSEDGFYSLIFRENAPCAA